jgi:hypothetical protein
VNDLEATVEMLALALHEDAFMALASAVTWLDPLWTESSGERIYDDDAESDLHLGLSITRFAFPGVYAGAIEQMRNGISERETERFICDGITERGIPLGSLEFLGAGIPLDAGGINLEMPAVYECYPSLLPLVALFGIEVDMEADEEDGFEVPLTAYQIARLIVEDLQEQPEAQWQQVGWALAWVFSCSGNSLVDYDNEVISEWEPLHWDKEDVRLAITMIEEADEIMRDADAGLHLLTRPELIHNLTTNIKRVEQFLTLEEDPHDPTKRPAKPLRLEWSPVITGIDGTTLADAELLQLRCDAA